MAAPADLEPLKGLGSGLGSGRSGSTCKVEIDDTCPAHKIVQDAAAHIAPAQIESQEEQKKLLTAT